MSCLLWNAIRDSLRKTPLLFGASGVSSVPSPRDAYNFPSLSPKLLQLLTGWVGLGQVQGQRKASRQWEKPEKSLRNRTLGEAKNVSFGSTKQHPLKLTHLTNWGQTGAQQSDVIEREHFHLPISVEIFLMCEIGCDEDSNISFNPDLTITSKLNNQLP